MAVWKLSGGCRPSGLSVWWASSQPGGWLQKGASPERTFQEAGMGNCPPSLGLCPEMAVSFPPHSMGERTIDSSRSKGWRNGLHLLMGAGVESTLQKSIGRGEISVVIFGMLVTVMGQTRTVQTEIVISTSKLPPLKRYVLGIPNVSRGLENQQ